MFCDASSIDKIVTERLLLNSLALHDDAFILELVNTPGWIRFIGDRHIHSIDDAQAYIRKIIANSDVRYWIVNLQATDCTIGIVTLIKRDYLQHYDIGFAFLPQYKQQGYAYEATKAVLDNIIPYPMHTHILGVTNKENCYSIRLLEKLGLQLQQELIIENETLLVYSIAAPNSI